MNKILTLGFCLLLLSACGQSTDDQMAELVENNLYKISGNEQRTPDSIYGVWGKTFRSNGISIDARIVFTKNQVVASAKCRYPQNKTVYAVVWANGQVEANEVQIFESAHKVTEKQQRVCSASLDVGQFGFQLKGYKLADFGAFSGSVPSDNNSTSPEQQFPQDGGSSNQNEGGEIVGGWLKLSDLELTIDE